MARSAFNSAKILTEIHAETFGNDVLEKYRIQWQQLREVCGVEQLDYEYLSEIVGELNELGFSLAPFDDCILVIRESECSEMRSVPGRLVEKYLPTAKDHEEQEELEAFEQDELEED